MAQLKTRGLRKTVGVPGLFATAYGNVGSSLYYALGLVAAHALGLTPVVFLFAGGLFALTAKTYAEGAAMYPEAGGSSSFARHAFNEFISFFAGWALSLDYILVIAVLAWLNIRGIGESAKLNFVLAIADLVTQVLIIIVGAALVLKPSLLV